MKLFYDLILEMANLVHAIRSENKSTIRGCLRDIGKIIQTGIKEYSLSAPPFHEKEYVQHLPVQYLIGSIVELASRNRWDLALRDFRLLVVSLVGEEECQGIIFSQSFAY